MYKKINYNQFRENWKWYIQKGLSSTVKQV